MTKLVMPPKTRRNKATKALKENICVANTNKLKQSDKVIKPPRKALADKTNSASDDNASVLIIEKQPTKGTPIKKLQGKSDLNVERSRRVRRLPQRYKENNVLKNLSNSSPKKDSFELPKASSAKNIVNPIKNTSVVVLSPLKAPNRVLDNSLIQNRPKRICRLPSKFDDHSISPNKFIPVQPINASTPLANKTKKVNKVYPQKTSNEKNIESTHKVSDKKVSKQKTLNEFFNKETIADSNNNAKQKRRKPQNSPKTSPNKAKSKQAGQKFSTKNTSIRVLDDNKKTLKRDSSKVDIYEFTYDPEEEPPPAKKKKKKTVPKRPPKPKITIRSNYDKNLAKALAALKNTVSSKPCTEPLVQRESAKTITNPTKTIFDNNKDISIDPNTNLNKEKGVLNERNYNSVRLEDIVMDMQPDEDDNIDYSPVNSPGCPQTTMDPIDNNQSENRPNDDPLNLRDDISFFDEQPVASSSMNVSVRHPLASPWRVEFGNLPIKWQVNTYVKPNMTPAVESSFISFNDTKKKHVYTNMVAEANDSLPQVVESYTNLKQTSIMSFIKEVVDKSVNKKKKTKSTPIKTNSLFEDISNTSIVEHNQTKQPLLNNDPKANSLTPIKDVTKLTNNSSNISNETDNSDVQKNVAENATPKDKKKKKDKNVTYFGFDESEDQENVSPKKKNKARSLRSRTKGILKELNVQNGPTRAIIPVAVKSKPIHSSDVVNKLFDGMKSATEPPVFPEVAVNSDTQVTKVAKPAVSENLENEDSECVHLFEDIEFVHHHKPTRKSYSKPKRVVFNKTPAVDNDSDPLSDVDQASNDEDLDDLSFKLPSVKPTKVVKRKKTNKQKLSKKEEKEVEAWAAGFNSMCEDIDEFDLVVE